MKANHNSYLNDLKGGFVGFNILKEQIESKSQRADTGKSYLTVGFNILKEQIESKSQRLLIELKLTWVGFNILKEQIESKSQH
ncbi:MAG: hypothetical protein AMXMBFR50_03080 [Ignavibacterium album]